MWLAGSEQCEDIYAPSHILGSLYLSRVCVKGLHLDASDYQTPITLPQASLSAVYFRAVVAPTADNQSASSVAQTACDRKWLSDAATSTSNDRMKHPLDVLAARHQS